MADLKTTIENSFSRYAGNVILNRAICDARDMLKPSARMLMYSQLEITKNIPSKPFVKSARVVGDALGHYYEHGDSSCYGTYMRMAKPFAMRYPLEDCQGNSGTLNSTSDEASMRYTELRLSPLGYNLFNGIDKETILNWSVNFDETESYPKVLPTKGFYNICNGTIGLGIAISSSIPQFNLREVNESLIKLLWNENLSFEEICILPDFATGAILLNKNEVIESLRLGQGAAIKLRSIIEYDTTKRALIVRELPYGVYTETISEQITKLLEKYPDCGIDNVNDASNKKPDYEIYLTKKAKPEKVLKLLYKETSLQSYFSINMTVLVDGKKPVVLGLKDLFLEYLKHQKIVYTREFQFNLKKIEARLHILNGLIKAISLIDEVVKTIKQSKDTNEASIKLQQLLMIDAVQAKAILDLKLARLTHLDITKLENEKQSLEKDKEHITKILNDEILLKKEIEKDLIETSKKFGDARRTQVINLNEENDEPIEEKQISLSFTNKDGIFVTETSTLYTQRRNSVGAKFKLDKDEYIVDNIVGKNTDTILFFTKKGNFCHLKLNEFTLDEKQYISNYITLPEQDHIIAAACLSKTNLTPYILFVTKNGLIKKSELIAYNLKRSGCAQAIKLDTTDEIVSILFLNEENIGILSQKGNFIIIQTNDIRAIGRVARGVQGIKLIGDNVVAAKVISNETTEIISTTQNGLIKRTPISDFKITGRATKGAKIQKADNLCDFLPNINGSEMLIVSSTAQLKVKISEIPQLSRDAIGVKAIKLAPNAEIIKISNC